MSAPARVRRINVILTVEQYERLQAEAQRSGESMATLIRQAIERTLGRKES